MSKDFDLALRVRECVVHVFELLMRFFECCRKGAGQREHTHFADAKSVFMKPCRFECLMHIREEKMHAYRAKREDVRRVNAMFAESASRAGALVFHHRCSFKENEHQS